jgi:hypothetical protein
VINDEANNILNSDVFLKFKTSFLKNNQYIQKFKLEKISKIMKNIINMSEMNLKDTLERKMIIREFLIENAYHRYMEYMMSDAFEKYIDDVYHMLTFDIFKINDLVRSNIVFLHASDNETWLYNSKYFDIWEYFDFNAPTHIIIRIKESFEYVQYVQRKKFTPSLPPDKVKIFMKQMNKIKETYNQINSESANDEKYLYSSDDQDVNIVVLGMNFKAIGIIENKMYKPFNNEIRVNLNKLPHVKFMFADAIQNQENDETSYLRRIDLDLFVSTHDVSTKELNAESKFNNALYRLGDLMKKKKTLMENYNILHHELTHLSTDEKIRLIDIFLLRAKINIKLEFPELDSIKLKEMTKMIILIHIDDLQEEYKSNTVLIDQTEQLVSQAEVKNNKLLKIHESRSEYIKPVERGFDDFTTHEHINMNLIN